MIRLVHAVTVTVFEAIGEMVRLGRWKLLPAFVIFLVLAILLIFVKAIAPIAPFVYSLF